MDRKLPDGWVWTSIEKVTQPIQKVNPRENPDKEFIYLDISSIDNTIQQITSPKSYVGADAPSRARQLVKASDVLFSTVRTYLKNVSLVPDVYDGQIASTGFSVLRASPATTGKYLFYYSQTDSFLNPLNELQRGTSYPAVRDSDVREQPIPIPPLPEQERIVRRIESLFTRLDAGVAGLKRAQAALKRYRASVLKAACEGRLIANGDAVSIQDNGLPPDWQWTTVRELTQKMQYGTSEKAHMDEIGIPVLRMGNIQDGELDFNNLKYLSENTRGIDSLMLDPGDVLFNRTNSAELVGKTAVYRENHPRSTFASYLIRVKLKANVLPDYVSFYINSYLGRRYIASVVSQQVGQANVNGTKLANMPIPLPPFSEQKQIVAEVERRLSVVQEVEAAVQANLRRAARLRQAILKRAFEGRLV